MMRQRLALLGALILGLLSGGRASSGLLALVVATWLGAGAAAADETSEALRPCTRADLIGTWAVIRFGTAPSVRVDPADPYFHPHQRYVFHTNASMRHLTSTTPVTRQDHRAMLAAAPTSTWAVDDRGRLLVQKAGGSRPQVDVCQVLVMKVNDPRSSVPALPGDLLLTHYDEDENPVARRLLRKLAEFRE